MRAIYVPVNEKDWLTQLQTGHGLGSYAGERYQRGSGLGSIFGPLLRSILPVAARVGKAVGRQALRTGAAIAQDVAAGKNVKQSAKRHTKQGVKQLAKKGAKQLTQKGKGMGVRPKNPPKNPPKTIKAKKKPRKKKTKRDAFGLY